MKDPFCSAKISDFGCFILNGAVYFGYRTDVYRLRYKKTPFSTYKRDITHYGMSVGVFSGFGASQVDPFVTLNRLDIEYEGLVNPSGELLSWLSTGFRLA